MTNTKYQYEAFGLYITSSLRLPELLPTDFEHQPDVVIEFAKVPNQLENPVQIGVTYQTAPNLFLFTKEEVARYYVTDGKSILIERVEESKEEDVRLFLLSSGFGALLHQREAFMLHGSAINYQGEAVLFVGDSGAGKSSLSTAFRLKGYSVLTDDVCVIEMNEEQHPIALPGYPQSKLWEEALENLSIDYKELKKVRSKIGKRAMPIKDAFCKKTLPIKAIYWLNIHNQDNILIEAIKGGDKFGVIKNMTYRRAWLDGFGVQKSHFKNGMLLTNKIPIKKITRTNNRFCVDEIVQLVLNDLSNNN